MEASEVQDRESLERYLKALPEDERREVALRVAYRAVARVLPDALLYVERHPDAEKHELTSLNLFSGVISAKLALDASETALYNGATIFQHFADTLRRQDYDRLGASAVGAAAFAAHSVSDGTAIGFAARAAAESAESVVSRAALDIWPTIHADLSDAEERSLWPEGVPEAVGHDWAQGKVVLRTDPTANWSFWIAWYDRVLAGRDTLPDTLASIFNRLTKEDWIKGPAHINLMFDDVLAMYRADDVAEVIDATPLAEDVLYDPDRKELSLVPLDGIAADYLIDIRAQIESARDILNPEQFSDNAIRALAEEERILQQASGKHRDRPVMILKSVMRVLARFDHKVMVGDCPSADQDANIADFQSVLQDVQVDLIGFSPEVRKYHEAAKPAVREDAVEIVAAGARALIPASDAELAAELQAEVEVLEDTTQDGAVRQQAFYRIVGWVPRAYRAVRAVLKESAGVTKDAAIVIGSVTALVKGVPWLFSPAFLEFISTVLKAFGRS